MAFDRTSRYHKLPRREHRMPDGRVVRYTPIRFIDTPVARRTLPVRDGDRTDLLAARAYRDPERYWRICDANRVLWPEDLVSRPGVNVLVPSPED